MQCSDEYGPVVTLEGLRVVLKKDRFHPRVRLLLQTFVLLTSNANIDFLSELILITGETNELSDRDEEQHRVCSVHEQT